MNVAVPQNWKSNIEQMVKGYETEPAKGLIHGLQKDLIQNSWGQRKDLEFGEGWEMQFSLIKNELGTFLVSADYGTYGLDGPNISMAELANLNTDLDANYRLARFSVMNYSGGNIGAGLYGRGKLIFSAVSKCSYYIFESRSKDGYRVNYKKLVGNTLTLNEKALEGIEAVEFLRKETGLDPMVENGTRIITMDPTDELIFAIESGEFLKNIEETWWPIIKKYNAKIIVSNLQGEKFQASVPSEYLDENLEHQKTYSNISLPGFGASKILNLKFGISKDDISEDLLGTYVYRKDMKMGEIPLNIPDELTSKFFGSIEVDPDFEAEITTIENLEHYGFTKKRSNIFQTLKQVSTKFFEDFLEETGYSEKKVSKDTSAQNELLEAAGELDSLLNSMNLSNQNSSNHKNDKVVLKWNGMEFPTDKANYLTANDEIKNISFIIQNNYSLPKKFQVSLKVICDNNTILTLLEQQIHINSNQDFESQKYKFKITEDFFSGKKHSIVLMVSPLGTVKQESLNAHFYVDMEKPDETEKKKAISLKSHTIAVPNPPTKRVNTNEKIENISYKIVNSSAYVANLGLNVALSMQEKPKTVLETICLKTFTLQPHSEVIIKCEDIDFSKEKYEDIMLKGPIELSATLVAIQDFGKYETSEIVAKNPPFLIYLNQDDSFISQTFNNVQMLEGNELRSLATGIKGNWTFSLYKDHPKYLQCLNDENLRKEYLIEEMLKQTIYVHLSEGNTSILAMFIEDMAEIDDLSEAEILKYSYSVIDKIQLQRNL